MAISNGNYLCYTEPGTELVVPLTGPMAASRVVALIEAQAAAAYRYGCTSRYGLTQCGYPRTKPGETLLQHVIASSRDERGRLMGLTEPLPVFGGMGQYVESIVFTLDGEGHLVGEPCHAVHSGLAQPRPFVHALTHMSGVERMLAMRAHEREARLSGTGNAYLTCVEGPPSALRFVPLAGGLAYVEAIALAEAQGQRQSHYAVMTQSALMQVVGYDPGKEGREAIDRDMAANHVRLQELAGIGLPLPVYVSPRVCGFGNSRHPALSHVITFSLDPMGCLSRTLYPPP